MPDFAALELDAVAVVGKSEVARIYGLIGPPEYARTPAFFQVVEVHSRLLAAYRAQQWDAARALIDECAAIDPRLWKLHRRYRRRIARYEQEPPGPDWDGVFRAQAK